MARVKGGIMASKRRKNILSQVKGYRFARSKKTKAAREAIFHANLHAFAHRKDKKNDFRKLWIARINAALQPFGMKYSRFIKALSEKNITLNRKVLATLANERPDSFKKVVDAVK